MLPGRSVRSRSMVRTFPMSDKVSILQLPRYVASRPRPFQPASRVLDCPSDYKLSARTLRIARQYILQHWWHKSLVDISGHRDMTKFSNGGEAKSEFLKYTRLACNTYDII